MTKHTHQNGRCSFLVCPFETERRKSDKNRVSRLDYLARITRNHGECCPCNNCKEIRSL